jgi:thioredoxin 2
MVHACPACSAKNRIPAKRLDGRARCGRCKAQLLPLAAPIVIRSREELDELVNDSPSPVLVDFWAPWCGPCQFVGPEIAKLAQAHAGKVVVAKVNTEEMPELAARYGIRSIPTFLRFDGGRETVRHSGAQGAAELAAALRVGQAA